MAAAQLKQTGLGMQQSHTHIQKTCLHSLTRDSLHSFYTPIVDGGHRAVKYSRVFGVQKEVFAEGTHFVIPWFETPIIYDVRAKPRNVASLTGTKGKLTPP